MFLPGRLPLAHSPADALEEEPDTHTRTARVILMVVVLAAGALPLSPRTLEAARDAPSASPDGWLTFRTRARAEDVHAAGAELLEEYSAFVVARGPPSSLDRLAERGHRADPMPDGSVLHLLGGPQPLRVLESQSAGPWPRNGRETSIGLVHVHAPFKDRWRFDWESHGISILRYVPQNGFLVRAEPAALEWLRSLPYVDWMGPYHPSWKLSAGIEDADGPIDVRIAILPGERSEAVDAWLAHYGVPARARAGQGTGIAGSFGTGDFRWVRARVPGSLLRGLAELPQVEFIEAVRTPTPWTADTNWVLQTNRLAGNGSRDLRYWWYGLDGRGQFVAMSDTGVDYDHGFFRESAGTIANGDLYNVTDPSRRKVVRYLNMGVLTGQIDWPGTGGMWDPHSMQDSRHVSLACTFGHGTAVASTLTGNDGVAGSPNDGVARGAKLHVQDIGTVVDGGLCPSDDLAYLPEDLADMFGPAGLVYHDPNAPVRIHSNSWGTAGVDEYDIQARMVDAFVWDHPDLLALFAVGNEGSGVSTVGSPGTAKNVLTVGGAGNPDSAQPFDGSNDLATLSSRGPTADGRIKPTIVTVFDGDSGMSDGDPTSGSGLPDAHWFGSSFSTPAAAGAAAIVRQYFADGWHPAGRPVAGNVRPDPSAALVRAVLVASGVQLTGFGLVVRPGDDTWPNNEQGFGRVLLSNVLPIVAAGDTFRTQVVDKPEGLLTGEEATYIFRVADSGRAAKFVLTWSDYPGTIGASRALVNDLDLEVVAPNGTTVYRGNNFGTFSEGESVPDGSVDATNVEEAVILKTPAVGTWTVRVIGSNVPVGPQPFALVATGNLDGAFGRVALDRMTYRPGTTARIEVDDSDAAAVQVRVTSTFEPTGEIVILAKGGPDEPWRGSIPIAFGPAADDGILQVRDGDIIRAVYSDSSPLHTAEATARVDAVGPAISAVSADRPGTTSVRIRWVTDEPATSGVRYGTSPTTLADVAETTSLRTTHELALTGLQARTMYYYEVVSRDRHGQETRDTNGGRHYRFQTDSFGDALLVIGDESLPEARVASWASALDGKGWTWSAWRNADAGPPSLGVLQAHRVILWQTGLEQYPPFDAAERDLVKAYLDGGGRLLITSHDTAWALEDPASTFRSAESEAWLRGVLKVSLACDPSTVGQANGVPGDVISANYTAGVSYVPHRDGGAVDELNLLPVGGTSSSSWTDALVANGGCGGRPIGMRWVSASNNGTAGVGIWGGTPSRLVYFAFELTGLDATASDLRPMSAIRADVLDRAIRWLVSSSPSGLDRDHPDVTVTAPNGGTFGGPTIQIDWTASVAGAGLASFSLDYSGDGGQTWAAIGTSAGASRTFSWDIASLPNGDRYLVRVMANDDGSPSLRGRDESDTMFTVLRPGGDTLGPVVWAGSVRVAPNPPGAGTVAWINATADDSNSGGSAILGAEFFLASSQPPMTEEGNGTPMDAADGVFDEAIEGLTWSGGLAVAPGGSCVWIHARDAGGVWGPFESTCFVVITGGPDVTPPASGRPRSARLVNGQADLEIVWDKAWDEGLFGGAVTYRVIRASSAQETGVNVSGDILGTGNATYVFRDPGRGAGDPSDYFYRIEAIDAAGNQAVSEIFAAKARIPVASGSNLLGMPLEASDPGLATMAGSLPWTAAWTYDACAGGFRWRSALRSAGETLALGLGRGFWLNGTASGSLLAVGIVPATGQVMLCAGWNLVSLPGFPERATVSSVKAATGADSIVGFDPLGAYHTRLLGDAEVLRPGQGIWIHVPASVTWSVPGS